jgi:hypothetical protein
MGMYKTNQVSYIQNEHTEIMENIGLIGFVMTMF